MNILEPIANWVMDLISASGYWGVILCMAIESCLIPLPSEIIMPFSGFLVSNGRFNLWLVTLAGGFGNLLGSIPPYFLGYWGREKVVRKFVKKWGKFILVTEHELDQAIGWTKKYGNWVTFLGRLLPGVRTVVSLPAGIARVNFLKFCVLTITGSLMWSFILAFIGMKLGENWDAIGKYLHGLDLVIITIGVGMVGFYVWYKLRNPKHQAPNPK